MVIDNRIRVELAQKLVVVMEWHLGQCPLWPDSR
jgi:hypothetical protein